MVGRLIQHRLREALELPHLHLLPPGAPEDEVAFRRHTGELTANYAIIGSLFLMVVIVVWWPFDWLVHTEPRTVGGFARMRLGGFVLSMVTLGLFLGSSQARQHSPLTGTLAYGVLLGGIGYSLGRLGGTELSWLADANLGLVPSALLPLRLGPRVLVTLLLTACLQLSFFLPFPANWQASTARGQVSFALFALVTTVVVGEMLYRVLRRLFFQQQLLARARAGLVEMNASLAARMATQARELRSFAGHLDHLQEAERRHLSRELHDDLAQELTAMRYALARFETAQKPDSSRTEELVSDLNALLDGVMSNVRGIITDLRPRLLEELGLVAATEWLGERIRSSGEVDCQLTITEEVRAREDEIEPPIALVLFRTLQEATANVRKHAHARRVFLSLSACGDEIWAQVEDDGDGFDPSRPSAGFGLLGLKERAYSVRGQLSLDSSPGQGTRLLVRVPTHLPPTSSQPEGAR